MPPDYDLLPSAIGDLLGLVEHVGDYGDEVVDRLTDALYDGFERLAEFPGLGRERGELAPDLRGFALNKQRVTIFYYEPSDARPRLSIVRVIRQSRDVTQADFA